MEFTVLSSSFLPVASRCFLALLGSALMRRWARLSMKNRKSRGIEHIPGVHALMEFAATAGLVVKSDPGLPVLQKAIYP